MSNINDTEAMLEWIMEKIEDEPNAIRFFMQQPEVINHALEYFNDDWVDHCVSEEPSFPYFAELDSDTTINFEENSDVDYEYSEGTEIEVLKKDWQIDRDEYRQCRLVLDEWDILYGKTFWLALSDIHLEEGEEAI